MRTLVAAISLVGSCSAVHAQFAQPSLSQDRKSLTYLRNGQPLSAPAVVPEQEQFGEPAVARDGRTIGWLAYTPNCCTSYPIPSALVILRDGQPPRYYSEGQPIWRWAFVNDGAAVAYAVHPTHGRFVVNYTLRRVSDGKPLAKYACDPDDPGQKTGKVAPAWVRAVAFGECPIP